MKMATETITIFNAYLDDETGYDRYQHTVITGASWYGSIETNIDQGLKAANKFTVRIPEDADFHGKSYLDPINYAKYGDPQTHWTLQNGDIVIRGQSYAYLTDGNETYIVDMAGNHILVTADFRPSEAQAEFPEMFTILGVTDNRHFPHSPHWKVVGS